MIFLFIFHIKLGFTSYALLYTENQRWKKQKKTTNKIYMVYKDIEIKWIQNKS